MVKDFLLPVRTNDLALSSTLPYMLIALTYKNLSKEIMALLDTGTSLRSDLI